MLKRNIRSVLILILIVSLTFPFFTTPAHAAYENTYTNTGNMRNDIIGVALTQVGYTEGDNNYTKYGVWYGQANSPWCGMFISWCANEAGIPTSVLKRTGIANPSNFGLSYQDGESYTPQKGDLFFKKSFSHVGLVYYTEGEYFYTIEGNTSTTGSDGTSVMIRKRKISEFYFSSPNYSGSSCSHSYETKVDTEHPHKEYKLCTKCSTKSYTGTTITNTSCKTCVQNACNHTFGKWIKSDNSKHSRMCSKCDFAEIKSHTWENGKILTEATCTDAGSQQIICSVCDSESSKSIAATNQHTFTAFSYLSEDVHQKVCSSCNEQHTSEHTVSNNWHNNNLYHWTSCADCGGRIRNQEHRFDNGCNEPCIDCGYISNNGHKGNGELLFDDNTHWEYCKWCNEKTGISSHSFTSECDETCNGCDYVRTATVTHKDTLAANDAGHWMYCSTCDRETKLEAHHADTTINDWETQYCTVCSYELRSDAHHEHTFATVESDNQKHWGTCHCGEALEEEVHKWDIQTGKCSICHLENTASERSAKIGFFAWLWNLLFNR